MRLNEPKLQQTIKRFQVVLSETIYSKSNEIKCKFKNHFKVPRKQTDRQSYSNVSCDFSPSKHILLRYLINENFLRSYIILIMKSCELKRNSYKYCLAVLNLAMKVALKILTIFQAIFSKLCAMFTAIYFTFSCLFLSKKLAINCNILKEQSVFCRSFN